MQNPVQPVLGARPSAAIKDHDFALYFDGVRVPAEMKLKEGSDGIEVIVAFRTSRSALLDPSVDPKMELAWGGWRAGDTCHLYQPSLKKMPPNGFVAIEGIVLPARADEMVMFRVHALTAVHDWHTEKEICKASERALIPADWFQK